MRVSFAFLNNEKVYAVERYISAGIFSYIPGFVVGITTFLMHWFIVGEVRLVSTDARIFVSLTPR